jgi:hypothetical protein
MNDNPPAIPEDYTNLKTLPDGTVCAIMQMAYTYGLFVGMTPIGYQRRYCYEHEAQAITALNEYANADEHPTGPWVKCKGHYKGIVVDMLNPAMTQRHPMMVMDNELFQLRASLYSMGDDNDEWMLELTPFKAFSPVKRSQMVTGRFTSVDQMQVILDKFIHGPLGPSS